jgi:hypothetical protein
VANLSRVDSGTPCMYDLARVYSHCCVLAATTRTVSETVSPGMYPHPRSMPLGSPVLGSIPLSGAARTSPPYLSASSGRLTPTTRHRQPHPFGG